VDLKDVDLQDAFRFLADAGDVSIVVGDDVRGKVTVRLKKVPWEQAMCTIAASKRLEVEVDGTVYLVTARAPR
jgi:type IV pilus assembly protein PilQ